MAWNHGFMITVVMIFQIVSGIVIAMFFTPTIYSAYQSIVLIIKEKYTGWMLYNTHTYGASFVFFFVYIHIFRGLYHSSYLYNSNLWISGCLLYVLLMAVGFMGYVLAWGEMSYWGATVITNLLSPVPNFLEWACGTIGTVGDATLKRFFVFHFLLGLFVLVGMVLHFFYLHSFSSSSPLGHMKSNTSVSFLPYSLIKDYFGLLIFGIVYYLQCFTTVSTLTHPDNTIEASGIVTPLHIVPEWYFLFFYGILKCVPNKNSGFLLMILSIVLPFIYVTPRKMMSLTIARITMSKPPHYIIMFCILTIIGGLLPSDFVISYSRVIILFLLLEHIYF